MTPSDLPDRHKVLDRKYRALLQRHLRLCSFFERIVERLAIPAGDIKLDARVHEVLMLIGGDSVQKIIDDAREASDALQRTPHPTPDPMENERDICRATIAAIAELANFNLSKIERVS